MYIIVWRCSHCIETISLMSLATFVYRSPVLVSVKAHLYQRESEVKNVWSLSLLNVKHTTMKSVYPFHAMSRSLQYKQTLNLCTYSPIKSRKWRQWKGLGAVWTPSYNSMLAIFQVSRNRKGNRSVLCESSIMAHSWSITATQSSCYSSVLMTSWTIVPLCPDICLV